MIYIGLWPFADFARYSLRDSYFACRTEVFCLARSFYSNHLEFCTVGSAAYLAYRDSELAL